MKKSLIALAVGGAFVAPAALAQTSNVVLSGQLKLGYEYIMPDDANLGPKFGPGAPASGTQSFDASRIANETSFVRFSGSEDLGNGLRAVFQIESEVRGDVQGGYFASRNTGAGLSSNAFGTIMFGRWDTHYLSHAGVEGAGFGGNALALKANSLNLLNWVNGFGAAGTRLSNVLRYVTPNWAGFEAEAIYSFDSEPLRSNGVDGRQQGKPGEWNAVLRYNAGPINAFASYIHRENQALESANYGNTLLSVSALNSGLQDNAIPINQGTFDLDGVRAGFAWTFPFGQAVRFKAGVIYDWIKWEYTTGVNNATTIDSKRDVWSVPLSLAFGPHTIFANWAIALDAKGSNANCPANQGNGAGCNGSDTGAQQYMVGYDYALSKRTSVGGNWVMIDNDRNGYYDYWTRGVGVTRGGQSPQSFYVGLRHLF